MICNWNASYWVSQNSRRWTIFGLTCLSWLFVVSSTGTCSFVSDTFYTNVDYGLFCAKIADTTVCSVITHLTPFSRPLKDSIRFWL